MTEVPKGGSPFVSVENLSKRFGTDWALARANFSVDLGKLALLTGSNGSGKTTLLRCLATSLVPDFGRASIAGHDLVAARDDVRRLISTLSQPVGFYGGLSARENLLLTHGLLGLSVSEKKVDALLDRVGLARKPGLAIDAFSSGMKQRFALARLGLVSRGVVLLDEPETHLDAEGLALLLVMIREWKAEGVVVICATHSPDRFAGIADQEIRLVAGRPDGAEAR